MSIPPDTAAKPTDAPQPVRRAPVQDPLSRPFWQAAAAHRLMVQRCGACGHWQHPPAPHCHRCRKAEALAWQTVSGRGHLVSWTEVRQGLVHGFKDCGPYLNLLVELDEEPGLLMVADTAGAPIAGWTPTEGARMQVCFQDLDGFTLPQFRPVEAFS